MSAEKEIANLLAADAPPARDLAFEIALAQRIERRRFARELAAVVVAGLVSIGVLALVMPFLETLWQTYFARSGLYVIFALLMAGGVFAMRFAPQRG